MEPSGSEASETRSKDKGNAPVIDVDSENVNQHVDEHIDERVTNHVDEQKKKRQEIFKKGVKFEKVACKIKSCLDVDTRWNSTFFMLKIAIKFEKVFDRLELIERDYTSYFYNETEDGGEGTRMMPKTKKNKKNVVRFLTRMIGQMQVLDLGNKLKYLEFCLDLIYPKSQTETSNQGDKVLKRLKTLSMKTIEICKIVEDAVKEFEDDSSMKIDLDDGYSKYLETQYGKGDDYIKVVIYYKDGAEKRRDNSFDVLVNSLRLPKEAYDICNGDGAYLNISILMLKKIIQNGNSKKRILTGKDGVIRVLSPVSAAKIYVVEKERKARIILLMAIPKEHLRRFHGMDDAKEIWEAIRTRFGGNENSKKMHKVVLKQQFEAFSISQFRRFGKRYDRSTATLTAWSNLAMTMRTKPEIDTLSIDDLYNNLRVFEQEIKGASKTSTCSKKFAFVSQSEEPALNKVKSGLTDLDSQYLPGPQTALVLKDPREIGVLLLRPQQVIIGGTLDQTPIVIVDQLLLELIIHSRTWKILRHGGKGYCHLIRANQRDSVFVNFGAMLHNISRDDLVDLYKIMLQKTTAYGPEEDLESAFAENLRIMFDPPQSEDTVWSLPMHIPIVNWRYYDSCNVHCLNLHNTTTIYMLAERSYPLSEEVCRMMLKKKLFAQNTKVKKKLVKSIEKKVGIKA
ncbi:hypothetical protein Tco_0753138 [Tanacetum coccineum]